jgi:outer membrane protein
MSMSGRILVAAASAGLVLAPAAGAQSPAAPRFAYVNSQVILSRAPSSSEIQAAIAKERDALVASAQRLQDSLATMINDYSRAQATLTATQREEREKVLSEKRGDYERRMGQMEQDLQQRQFELVQPLMNQIREVLETIRNEEGYLFVFDVGAESNAIVAADKNLDITERVIARLRPIPVNLIRSDTSRAPAGAARPAPAGITRPPVRPPTR